MIRWCPRSASHAIRQPPGATLSNPCGCASHLRRHYFGAVLPPPPPPKQNLPKPSTPDHMYRMGMMSLILGDGGAVGVDTVR
jgi:hypothetical protein